MAEAKRLGNPPRRIERVVVDVVDVPDTIQITLRIDEAVTLKAVLGAVGGDAGNTRRGHTEGLYAALDKAGIVIPRLLTTHAAGGYKVGTITFLEEPGLDLS